MKTSALYSFILLSVAFLSGCIDEVPDKIPGSYFMIQLNPDDIYMYNGGNGNSVRLDPFLNDSIKVEVTVSYSAPLHGTLKFIANEGWFYTPNSDFFGIDNITYTVCHKDGCGTASITLYVEEPIDQTTCVFELNGETVRTEKNQPIEIRIFMNDVICSYPNLSVFSPEKGTFNSYSYSGSIKNIVYVYYPPKNFTGTDRFKYRIFDAEGNTLETYCTIIVE